MRRAFAAAGGCFMVRSERKRCTVHADQGDYIYILCHFVDKMVSCSNLFSSGKPPTLKI